MIAEVQKLLSGLQFSRAAIIDDAYDEAPLPEDIRESNWTRFFDDIDDEQEEVLRSGFGEKEYERLGRADLQRDAKFVTIVWSERARLGKPAVELFSDFEQQQSGKRHDLTKLEQLLENDLKLPIKKIGRRGDSTVDDAHIIFLDLFLGSNDDPQAIENSINKVRRIVEKRRSNPPVVLLMSASPRLGEFAVDVRDRAELLGCQFRTIKKSELSEDGATLDKLYDLIVCYPDSRRVSSFVSAWDKALTESKSEFLRTIRTIDLADYANMNALILEAEEENVGDYVIDLYDLYLHNVIEGKDDLIRAAKELNAINWDEYPPAQFMPSKESIAIADGALFHNERRTKLEAEITADPKAVRFGDVYLSSPAPEKTEAATSTAAAETSPAGTTAAPIVDGRRNAYMVMSQACDLAHGKSDRVMVLKGDARPYEWRRDDDRKSKAKTPIMIAGGEKFVLTWDIVVPDSWVTDQLPTMLSEKSLSLVRRFRMPFSLKLQRMFLDGTGRVATLASLPERYSADVSVFLRSSEGKAKRIAYSLAEAEDAVCLVGRTGNNQLKEWLLLSPKLQKDLAEAFAEAKRSDPPKHAKPFSDAVDDPAFHRALKAGLAITRGGEGMMRPFKQRPFDVVEISTKPKWSDGADVGTNGVPIMIEIAVR